MTNENDMVDGNDDVTNDNNTVDGNDITNDNDVVNDGQQECRVENVVTKTITITTKGKNGKRGKTKT